MSAPCWDPSKATTVRLGYELRDDDIRAVYGAWPPQPPPVKGNGTKIPKRDLRASVGPRVRRVIKPNPVAVLVIRWLVIVAMIVGAWIGIKSMATHAPLTESFTPYRVPASTLNDASTVCGGYSIVAVWLDAPGNPNIYRVQCSEGDVTYDWQH
jgi:hypothetical protein